MIRYPNVDLVDSLPAEVAVANSGGAIVRVNRRWEETARRGALARRPAPWNYIAECEAAIARGCREAVDVREGMQAVLAGRRAAFVSTYSCPFDGRHHWYQIAISPLDMLGEPHALVMHVDVSALQRDGLTKLPNRAMFDAQLDYVLTLARERDAQTGVIFVDVDHLKTINDRHGHPAGDAALTTIARELQAAAGPDCLVARVGGDEFGVVLPVNGDASIAPRVRAQFRNGVAFAAGPASGPQLVSASVGVALYPDDGLTAGALLKAADLSMYVEKRSRPGA